MFSKQEQRWDERREFGGMVGNRKKVKEGCMGGSTGGYEGDRNSDEVEASGSVLLSLQNSVPEDICNNRKKDGEV